jgi:MscS family membrane protein
MVSVISFNKLSLIEMGAILFIFGLLSFFLHRIVCRRKDPSPFWQRVEKIVHRPLQVTMWVVAVSLLLDLLTLSLGFEKLGVYSQHLAQAFSVGCIGFLTIRFSELGFSSLKERSSKIGINSVALDGLRQLTRALIVILTLLVLFQIFGLNILPLLTFGGIGLAGLTLAAQEIISNFFAGVMLHFSPPFQLGDVVELPAHHFQGEVEQIGWYGTFFRDAEKRQVFFPNSLFTKMAVVNLSKRTHGRIVEKISLPYRDLQKAPALVQIVKEQLKHFPGIDTQGSFTVALQAVNMHSAELMIDLLTVSKDVQVVCQLKEEILLLVQKKAEELGVEIK